MRVPGARAQVEAGPSWGVSVSLLACGIPSASGCHLAMDWFPVGAPSLLTFSMEPFLDAFSHGGSGLPDSGCFQRELLHVWLLAG